MDCIHEESLCQKQEAVKPKIEEIIHLRLGGVNKKLALDFVAFVRSLKMSPQWASAGSWAVSYKNKRVCYIKISDQIAGDGFWNIRPSVRYCASLVDFCKQESLEEVMLEYVHLCQACGRCAPGQHAVFFGREFDHVCCAPIDFEFHNSDAAAIECAKKLVTYRRSEILKG